jgi:putative endonuclease
MPTNDRRRTLGARGEACAAAHLEAAGYRILGRNVRADGVEIDLVVARGRIVAFVEVKTRASRRAGAPEEAVDGRKRARIVRGALSWLRANGVRGRSVRFDVVSVEPDGAGDLHASHRPGAFDAGDGIPRR